jgi:RNA-binding protein PNO1
MVVAYAEPSTSEVRKKKLRRKNKRTTAPASGQNQEGLAEHEVDANMDELQSTPAVPTTVSAGIDGDDELMIDQEPVAINPATGPVFDPLPASEQRSALKSEIRRIPMPPHRMAPLQKEWVNIFGPLTELLGLQVRMNIPRKSVEIRVWSWFLTLDDRLRHYSQTSKHTKEVGALQKGADFIKAFALGFDVNVRLLMHIIVSLAQSSPSIQDSIALLRLDDLYLDSFEIKDVKTLHGDHLSRAIGETLCPSFEQSC